MLIAPSYFLKFSVESFRSSTVLSLFLVVESHRSKDSKWKEYIDSLPDTYTTASYWSEQEVTSLPQWIKSKVLKRNSVRIKSCFKHTVQY